MYKKAFHAKLNTIGLVYQNDKNGEIHSLKFKDKNYLAASIVHYNS